MWTPRTVWHMENRRRTDLLPNLAEMGETVRARGDIACEAVVLSGMHAACLLQVGGDLQTAQLVGGSGEFPRIVEVARGLAERVAADGRALHVGEQGNPDFGLSLHFAAVPCGFSGGMPLVLVVADPILSRREAQTIAAWIAPSDPAETGEVGGPCGSLARELTRQFGGDVAVFALFAQSGMLLDMHVRSGALLRSWRAPVDTVWGEAARHGAAYVLGDLHLHPGAEFLSAIGFRSAAVVGLENGNGMAMGAFGVASLAELDTDIAMRMIERAATLGPQIMDLRSSTQVPRATPNGVNLHVFAARVGCRRFALYTRAGNVLKLVSAHAEDGSTLMAPPDPLEEQLVLWAAERGVAISATDAAAVLVGEDTVLYAQDAKKQPMEALRLALQDLRFDPTGTQAA